MNRIKWLAAAGIVLFGGCVKMAPEKAGNDQGGAGSCVPQWPEMEVTYDNYVKNIVARYCTESCHRGGNSLGTGNFLSYDGLKPHTGNIFYYRVIQDNADMPQDNAPLPKTIRDSLNIWIRNCAPEN